MLSVLSVGKLRSTWTITRSPGDHHPEDRHLGVHPVVKTCFWGLPILHLSPQDYPAMTGVPSRPTMGPQSDLARHRGSRRLVANGVECMSNYSELSTYHEYGNIFPMLCTVFALQEPEVRTLKQSLETSLRLAKSPSHSSVGRASDLRYHTRSEPGFESLRRSIY